MANEIIKSQQIEDNEQFSLVCCVSQKPLYNPLYFHNHFSNVINHDQIETTKELIKNHAIEFNQCYIANLQGQECTSIINSHEFYTPKTHEILKQIIYSKVLNASHEEFVQLDGKSLNKENESNNPLYYYLSKIYLSFKEDESSQIIDLINQNLSDPQLEFLQSEIKDVDATGFYWAKIDQLIENNKLSKMTEQEFSNYIRQYGETSQHLNLCLLTGNLVRIPVKLINCNSYHLECFDLNSIYQFMINNKTSKLTCPICKVENNFLCADQLYIDRFLLRQILKNICYCPLWEYDSTNLEMVDIYRKQDLCDIINCNKVYWNSKKNQDYQKNNFEMYHNQRGLVQSVSTQKMFQIPVRCVRCKSIAYYCDMYEQLFNPKNAKQCLCCQSEFEQDKPIHDQLILDAYILEELIKYSSFVIQVFTVVSTDPESKTVSFKVPLEYFQQKIPKYSIEQRLQFANLPIVKTIAKNSKKRITGLPVKWVGCLHEEFLDLDYVKEGIPRYCSICERNYQPQELFWDELAFEALKKNIFSEYIEYHPQNKTYHAKNQLNSMIHTSHQPNINPNIDQNNYANNGYYNQTQNVNPPVYPQKYPLINTNLPVPNFNNNNLYIPSKQQQLPPNMTNMGKGKDMDKNQVQNILITQVQQNGITQNQFIQKPQIIQPLLVNNVPPHLIVNNLNNQFQNPNFQPQNLYNQTFNENNQGFNLNNQLQNPNLNIQPQQINNNFNQFNGPNQMIPPYNQVQHFDYKYPTETIILNQEKLKQQQQQQELLQQQQKQQQQQQLLLQQQQQLEQQQLQQQLEQQKLLLEQQQKLLLEQQQKQQQQQSNPFKPDFYNQNTFEPFQQSNLQRNTRDIKIEKPQQQQQLPQPLPQPQQQPQNIYPRQQANIQQQPESNLRPGETTTVGKNGKTIKVKRLQ